MRGRETCRPNRLLAPAALVRSGGLQHRVNVSHALLHDEGMLAQGLFPVNDKMSKMEILSFFAIFIGFLGFIFCK
jgi:hypothetical protein